MKFFIITVDTEGDNLWGYKKGSVVTTENSRYIPRFQALCEKYQFKPVYLTNYEMLNDDRYIEFAKDTASRKTAEIGLHLHAWNNPPLYDLNDVFGGNAYLIEYPDEVMFQKFKCLFDLFVNVLGFNPVSHRAGRWATDERYFKILSDFNIRVDCSFTPGIDWSSNMGETRGGSDYRNVTAISHFINGVLEVPMTSRITHKPLKGGFKHKVKTLIRGDRIQLRPASNSISQMIELLNIIHQDYRTDYVEFMIHSAELMPGGSPYFKTSSDIESLYQTLDNVFNTASGMGYKGCTLEEYYQMHI